MIEKDLLYEFSTFYKKEPRIFSSPGRINLIGEHTDYNEGFVFPAAIDKKIYLAISPNGSSKCNLYSNTFASTFSFEISKREKSGMGWPDYIIGVVDELIKAGHQLEGFDCVVGGDVPTGAGLSSSAALETCFAFALNEINKLGLSRHDLAIISRDAENNFIGVKCGIMDQYAALFGKKDEALLLDCRNLEFENFKVDFEDYRIVLVNSGVKHQLANSEYNVRREQCEKGLSQLKKMNPEINSLRDVSSNLMLMYEKKLDPVIYKRCLYVAEENERAVSAAFDLANERFSSFGQKLFASHEGLKNDYEVSCQELDLLVELAKESKGIVGARMMGGGFGGCTINVVESRYHDQFIKDIQKNFKKIAGTIPLVYNVSISGGTMEEFI
ncbi:MAG: galactokinase [Bacteroidetes bacterium GWF2_38_335]|nr:MAG: galactokinase [Bacteroidetes bacterium GWF2_38_335]OFY80623.1 MAG: galactokinase [Bacteroidetes bacterium RIFOXYA12_FULL_38_20]HBS86963.1 galactokinase [Bacteroidales bacterium]